MKAATRCLQVSLILLATAFAGCVPLTTQGGDVIGTLRVSGPNVYLNSAQGRDGDTVLAGSSVTTGPGSSALVEFRGGGYLQIDENTDPLFDWLEQSKCILIRLIRGQAYLKRERACVEGPNISMVLNSEANILMQGEPQVTEVTVLKGSVDVSAPSQITLLPGQQFILSGRRIAALRSIRPAELKVVVGWRDKYRFRPLPVESAPEPIPFPTHRRRPSHPGEPTPSGPPPSTSTGGGATTPPSRVPGGVYREIGPPPSIKKTPEPVIR